MVWRASLYGEGVCILFHYVLCKWVETKGPDIPHIQGGLILICALIVLMDFRPTLFLMLFLPQVKVIRQGGNSSCKHLLLGWCLKAFSITCHDLLTCLLEEFMLEDFRPVQVFLYFDRVSFLHLFQGGVLL